MIEKEGLTCGQDKPLVALTQTERKKGLPVSSSVPTPTETLGLVNRCGTNLPPPGFC